MTMTQFCQLVSRVMKTLPQEFYPYLENLVVDVMEEADHAMLLDAGFTEQEIAEGETLLGLFEPLDVITDPYSGFAGEGEDPQLWPNFDQPHRMIIFKKPHEEEFPDPKQLRIEIRKTVIHELAHHFGYNERDLERFDQNPDPFGPEEPERDADSLSQK